MLKSVEAIFRNGKVEFLEPPPQSGETRVLVTFLADSGGIDLRTRGISESQAAHLRGRLGSIAEDWNSPEMDVYDE